MHPKRSPDASARSQATRSRPARVGSSLAWLVVSGLILVVLVFAGLRLIVDAPAIVSGNVPDPALFEHRYVVYPWLAYAHIVPGTGYLLLAAPQFWRGFRARHPEWHRRAGRVALVFGLVSGVFGTIFGVFLAFGGPLQASASVVFGLYFMVALALAYRAIRRRDTNRHRRWMIRAFAIGLAVGTIRLWVGLFQALSLLDFRDSFGIAFWLAFTMHAVAAELWLWGRPAPGGRRMERRMPTGQTRSNAPTQG